MKRLAAFLAFIFALAPQIVLAQGWELRTNDDGSFFWAAIRAPEGSQMSLLCGERSPQGLSPAQTGNTEPEITSPRTFRLNMSSVDIGQPTGIDLTRSDVMIVAGTTGYRLTRVIWNELFGSWETDLAANDPVFAAIAAVPTFELRSQAGVRRMTTAGFARSINQLSDFCQSMFATIGKPWYASQALPQERAVGNSAMRQAAEAAIGLGCNGPANRQSGYLLSGNIDGDGVEDVVLDWERVACLSDLARPFCGASFCSADVFISTAFPALGQPETLLAVGVEIIPLNNGLDGIRVGGSSGNCYAEGRDPCLYLYYWNGFSLVPAP